MQQLTPLVTRRKRPETLIDYYEHTVNQFLYGTENEELKKTYRQKLLGPDLIAGVPDEYAIMGIIEKVGYLVWDGLSFSERGKYIAYYRLENMAELLREHLRLQKQQEDDRIRNNK